jgi:hypothetical protein
MQADQRLEYLLNREDIRNVVSQYCRAFDRCDAELLGDVYWPDGMHEHGSFRGTGAEFVAFTMPKIGKYSIKSQHTINNFYFDIEGDVANVESYVTAFHLLPGDPAIVEEVFGAEYLQRHQATNAAAHDFIFLGRYIDLLERRGTKWRIKRRTITTEWSINQPSTAIWEGGLASAIPFLGRRGRSDPSYQPHRADTARRGEHFRGDGFSPPKMWGERIYANLLYWNDHPEAAISRHGSNQSCSPRNFVQRSAPFVLADISRCLRRPGLPFRPSLPRRAETSADRLDMRHGRRCRPAYHRGAFVRRRLPHRHGVGLQQCHRAHRRVHRPRWRVP